MSTFASRGKLDKTAECKKLGNEKSKMSSTFTAVIVFTAILLIGTQMIYYNNVFNGNEEIKCGTKAYVFKKVIDGLSYASIIYLGIAILARIWSSMVMSKTVKECMLSN